MAESDSDSLPNSPIDAEFWSPARAPDDILASASAGFPRGPCSRACARMMRDHGTQCGLVVEHVGGVVLVVPDPEGFQLFGAAL